MTKNGIFEMSKITKGIYLFWYGYFKESLGGLLGLFLFVSQF